MGNTPHISLRVSPERLEEWRKICGEKDVSVSTQIRLLMDAWVRVEKMKKQAAADDAEQQARLLGEAQKLLEHLNS